MYCHIARAAERFVVVALLCAAPAAVFPFELSGQQLSVIPPSDTPRQLMESSRSEFAAPPLPTPLEGPRAFQSDWEATMPSSPVRTQRVMVPQGSLTPPLPQDGPDADGVVPSYNWWQSEVSQPLNDSVQHFPITLEQLIAAALQHSAEVRVASDIPLIREMDAVEADADFDWAAFMETKWNDINDPVGNTLTTGGPDRFQDENFNYTSGLRRRTYTGGQFELSQKYGYQETNSIFFIPNPQGTARLSLSYTQPILRGGGRVYNKSLIVIAQLDTCIGHNEMTRRIQEHLFAVADSYWRLYLRRGTLLQRRKSLQRARRILEDLSSRRELDAVSAQIVRAESAVATRRAEIARAEAEVQIGESRVRSLVNDPTLGAVGQLELAPLDTPTMEQIPINMQDSLTLAFQNRPEVTQALEEIKIGSVRLAMSKNELLPILDVVLETYVSGLQGDSDIAGAFVDQFSEGSPSYTAGLQFELPLRNRAARARHQRRQLELRQLQNEFRTTLNSLNLEVEAAVREVEASYREVWAKADAIQAAQREVEAIEQRWRLLPGSDGAASLMLEDLLTAQDRLSIEESGYLSAQVGYNISLIELKRATGVLLKNEQVFFTRSESCNLPEMITASGKVAFPHPGTTAPWKTQTTGAERVDSGSAADRAVRPREENAPTAALPPPPRSARARRSLFPPPPAVAAP